MLIVNTKFWWYVARSSGLVAWGVLALSVAFGLVLSSRFFGRRTNPAWTLSVHRFLGGMGVVFTGLHLAGLYADDYVQFTIGDFLIPGSSPWRPGAVTWGVVSLYVLIAIEGTSLLMRHLPRRLWRAVHWLSPALFITASVHTYQAGTDIGRHAVQVGIATIVALAVLTTVRMATARRRTHRPRPLLPTRTEIGAA
ncbi:MAG: ferric reductase-like transmembrane domain-containing protein [Acidimicrobiia bacterium]|nr:ferric reductase-like transmembrane domain-containing protein [Acidimicrobiia bacterium]